MLLQVLNQIRTVCFICIVISVHSYGELLQYATTVERLNSYCVDSTDNNNQVWDIQMNLTCEELTGNGNQEIQGIIMLKNHPAVEDIEVYVNMYCFNETLYAVSSTLDAYPITIPNSILSSEISPSYLSGNVTCSAIGCYHVFETLGSPSSQYNLEVNSCSLPLVFPVYTMKSPTSVPPTIPVTKSSIFVTRTISSTESPSFVPPTIPVTNTTMYISITTLPLKGDSTTETNSGMVMGLALGPALVLTTMLTVVCAIVLSRKRRKNKLLTNWRTGYGLQQNQAYITDVDVSLDKTMKFPVSPSPSVYTILCYKVETGPPILPNDSLSLQSSIKINLCANVELDSTENQTKSTSDDEEFTCKPYIPSLIYSDGQQVAMIDMDEYEELFRQSPIVGNQAMISQGNRSEIVASSSVPIHLDHGDYIQALAYASTEAIHIPTNQEHERLRLFEVSGSKVETRSDGYLVMSELNNTAMI